MINLELTNLKELEILVNIIERYNKCKKNF